MTKMSREEMILFAIDHRLLFGGMMGNFLDNVILAFSESDPESDPVSEVQPMPDAALVGMRIKTAMRERGLNQRLLAQKTGVTEQSISRYINGQRTPNVKVMGKLSIALNASPGYFYGLETLNASGGRADER